jgi:polygalacturonase
MGMKGITVTILSISIFLIISCKYAEKPDNNPDDIHSTIPFDFPDLQPLVFNNQIFDIRDYGAQPNDSAFMNTDEIKKAITACNHAGGGKVLVSSGIWHTGPIHLQSNVNLHLEQGAELRFSKNFEDYLPVVLIQRGGFFCYNYSPPIYARNCENIAITGTGILNGQGQAWWPWKQRQPGMVQLFEMGKKRVPVEQRVFGTVEAGVRPPFIQFLECKNVYLQGVTVIDGPSWNVHPVWCENIIIREIKVIAHGPNNDGINPDGCKNVLIENCYVDAGDDALTMKSGRDEEAWEIGRPLENVVIRRCTVKKGNGGFVIGTEMSAGVRNILVEDCHFDGTSRGLRFKSRIGRGGIVENIWIRNITMKNIWNEAIIFNLLYDAEPIEKNMNYQSRHI